MVCLALELVGPWVVLGFSVGMEGFDELLSLMFLGVRSSLELGFGLKPPASGFQSYFCGRGRGRGWDDLGEWH